MHGINKRVELFRKQTLAILLIPVLSSVLMYGCGENKSDAAAHQAPPAVSVTVTPAIEKTIQPSEEWTGRFESPESVEIRSRVGGVIEHLYFKAGQMVHRGDLLFKIDPAPYQAELARAQAQLASAKTQAAYSKSEAVRSKKLLDARATSQQEFDQLHAQERNTASSTTAAEAAVRLAQLNLSYTDVRSPIDGRISRTVVTSGNLINAGSPVLTTVVSINPMHVYFAMSESSYLKSMDSLQKHGKVQISLGLANETGTPHTGALDFVDNRINPTTGTVQARGVFQNPNGMWVPGLFAHLSVPAGEPIDAVMVPEKAIGTDQAKKVVWVVDQQNKALPREITPGILVGNLRVVTKGLKTGENVIVEGTQLVQPGMTVKPQMAKTETQEEASKETEAEAAPSSEEKKSSATHTSKAAH